MLLFVLEQIAFCIGIILEKYWFNIVLFLFVLEYYWKSIGLLLFYISFCYWKSIRLTLFYVAFCAGKDGWLFDWNNFGKVLVLYVFKLFLYWNNIGKVLV